MGAFPFHATVIFNFLLTEIEAHLTGIETQSTILFLSTSFTFRVFNSCKRNAKEAMLIFCVCLFVESLRIKQ